MSSVYFPAHVVVLFRRLFNVVSTLSISTHDVRQTSRDETSPIGASNTPLVDDKGLPYDQREKIRRSSPSHRTNSEESYISGKGTGDTETPTINLPSWLHGWSSLFSSHEAVPNNSNYNNFPPPTMPPKPAPEQPPSPPEERKYPLDTIHQLLVNPALVDPVRTPRYPIVLCHGLYGFDSRGPSTFPSMRMHYWSNVLNVLRGMVGAEVIVTSVPGTGSIFSRAARLDEQLQTHARGRGVNFLAHSMGGLDCRHLISRIKPHEYAPLSLTSISTPHRGSPFMDWCESNIGIGKLRQQEKEFAQQRAEEYRETASPNETSKSFESSFTQSITSLPSSFTTLLLSVVDSPAYANLTSQYLNEFFNPNTPDDPKVKYFSVAGRMSADTVSIWHPFWLPKMVLDGVEEKERERLKKQWEQEKGQLRQSGETPFWADEREWGNDGLVTIQSAKWGEFLGTMEGCDHWEMRGARGIEFGVDIPAIPAIGLGSLPLASSISNPKRPSRMTSSAQGDGWGFGDWTRFVGAWMKSEANDAAADKAGSANKGTSVGAKAHEAHAIHSSRSPVSRDPALTQLDAPKSRADPPTSRGDAEDALVKSSTDTLSVVFDWLIERVPAPVAILRRSPAEKDKGAGKDSGAAASAPDDAGGSHAKVLGAAAVTHIVGVSASANGGGGAMPGAGPSSHSSAPSEMKRWMEKEDKGRRKQRELATKRDLERFYVALTRKMYESGL